VVGDDIRCNHGHGKDWTAGFQVPTENIICVGRCYLVSPGSSDSARECSVVVGVELVAKL
jgi:hypothetical protein